VLIFKKHKEKLIKRKEKKLAKGGQEKVK